MQISKIFKALNQVISVYSCNPITQRSLDCFLTIQIITQCMMNMKQMGLMRAELTILKKIANKANRRKENKKMIQSEQKIDNQKWTDQVQLRNSLQIRRSQKQLQQQTRRQVVSCTSQNNITQSTVLLIHQNGHTLNTGYLILLRNLLRNVDNIVVIDSQGSCYNNLLYHQYDPSLSYVFSPLAQLLSGTANNVKIRPLIIICVNQYKKYKEVLSQRQKIKRDKYLEQQMQKYLSTCDIFQGHLNLRVNMYSQTQCSKLVSKNTSEKLAYFAATIMEYRQSEDDYDILLRDQIPTNAYMKIVAQCGNRVNYDYILSLNDCYKIISCEPNLYYSFKVFSQQQKQSKDIGMLSADQVLIWVLLNGQPILHLLPLYQQAKKRGRCGKKNDKFKQKRSILGYTRFQMEEKLFQSQKTQKNNKPQKQINCNKVENMKQDKQNQDENDSIFVYDSEDDQNRSFVSQLDEGNDIQQPLKIIQEKTNLSLYIINMVKTNITEQQITQIITFEMKNIMRIFLKQRKQIYQNLQILKNLKLVNKIVQILNVDEKDVLDVLYLSKL